MKNLYRTVTSKQLSLLLLEAAVLDARGELWNCGSALFRKRFGMKHSFVYKGTRRAPP